MVIAVVLLAGCGSKQPLLSPLDRALDSESSDRAVDELLAADPGGPLAKPGLPPELASLAAQNAASLPPSANGPGYALVCESPEAPELAARFLEISTLARMQETPPQSFAALEQRLKVSLREGSEILRAYGYYAGNVYGEIRRAGQEEDPPAGGGQFKGRSSGGSEEAEVRVSFTPGRQFLLGSMPVSVLPAPKATVAPDATVAPGKGSGPQPEPGEITLPESLFDVGLVPGSPASADAVLAAVGRVQDLFRENGYPEATVASNRFFLDREKALLDAEILISPGPFMRMGSLEIVGGENVTPNFIQAKRRWRTGRPWSEDRVENLREALRRSGLFMRVDIDPGEKDDAEGNRPVVVSLQPAKERTVGGAVKYDTSFGPGVQGFWEHRNLTGRGDSLRLEMPLWADMQEFVARYRLPYFLRDDQDFLAQVALISQDTDAYEIQAGRFLAGVERRLSRHWSVSALGSVEGGSLKDPDQSAKSFLMLGVPLNINYDSTTSLLDARDGGRASLMLTPLVGEYGGEFAAVRTRLDLQRFIPFNADESFLLALRGSVGVLVGADGPDLPPSARFYSGGGGSVRGYEFQSLGPRNSDRDPLGGSSMVEMTIEPRYRFTETLGVVAFLDGGMVYDDTGHMGQDMRYGAGIGFRFYTAIGPMRFDVATPLNPRDNDDSLHFYISIGQSF